METKENFFKAVADGREQLAAGIDGFRDICHGAAQVSGWWSDPATGEKVERNVGELIALMHSELSEALEGHRKGLKDDHLPEYDSITVEFADTIIRILDCAGALGLPVGSALVDKLLYNGNRDDHKAENRIKEGGKKF